MSPSTFPTDVARANVSTVNVIVPVADHVAAAADLVRRYRELPPDARVRLGKPSSNLFRFGAPPPTLDASGLSGVIAVDPVARTADVAGMTTYEDLVDATLPHGLMPLVVPQLKTITLGGAVAGLGIESTSFRHGLPHESVREMEILTGAGEVVTATPDGEHADLYRGFPNSYGTLGYALRLVIDLQPVTPYVRLRHHRYPDAQACTDAIVALADRASNESAGDRLPRRHRLRPGGAVPDHRGVRRHAACRRHRERLHRPADLLPLPAGAGRRPPDRPRLPVALGHRLVLVLARAGRAEPGDPPVLAGPLPPVGRLPPHRGTRPPVRVQRSVQHPAEAAGGGAGRAGRRDPGAHPAGLPRGVPPRHRDFSSLALPVAAAGRRSPGRSTR